MKISKRIINLIVLSAIGAVSVLSSSAINAATLEFAEGPLIDVTQDPNWIGVGTDFTVNLVAKGLIDPTAGGGIGISFDNTLVELNTSAIDGFWDFTLVNVETDVATANTNGAYEALFATLTQSGINTTSQNILSLNFTVINTGVFDLGLYALGIAGDWAYTPATTTANGADLGYCLTTTIVAPAECLDSNPDPAGRELLTLVSSQVVVPVPAAAWLFGSGLIGLVGVARRKTA